MVGSLGSYGEKGNNGKVAGKSGLATGHKRPIITGWCSSEPVVS